MAQISNQNYKYLSCDRFIDLTFCAVGQERLSTLLEHYVLLLFLKSKSNINETIQFQLTN